VLARQLRNPLLVLLLGAALTSFFVGERLDALIIFAARPRPCQGHTPIIDTRHDGEHLLTSRNATFAPTHETHTHTSLRSVSGAAARTRSASRMHADACNGWSRALQLTCALFKTGVFRSRESVALPPEHDTR
jgi:hypothetical protein